MGIWKPQQTQSTAFENAVRWLNPAAKQAFYGAAASRTIARRTWNGCAFNAGGEELGIKGVSSVAKAAEVFDLPEKSVSNFIKHWDALSGTDIQCNEMLKDAILKVGLFSPRGSKRLRTLVFKAQTESESAALAQIENIVCDPEITDEQLYNMIEGMQEAMELMNA